MTIDPSLLPPDEDAGLPLDEPEIVTVGARGFRVRANDIRALKKATGLTLGDLLNGDDMADQTQAMAFLALRRKHPDEDPGELWERAGDIDVEFDAEPPTPDPTAAPSS
jgi:hypothetical protein